jgi:hypothetical protein
MHATAAVAPTTNSSTHHNESGIDDGGGGNAERVVEQTHVFALDGKRLRIRFRAASSTSDTDASAIGTHNNNDSGAVDTPMGWVTPPASGTCGGYTLPGTPRTPSDRYQQHQQQPVASFAWSAAHRLVEWTDGIVVRCSLWVVPHFVLLENVFRTRTCCATAMWKGRNACDPTNSKDLVHPYTTLLLSNVMLPHTTTG